MVNNSNQIQTSTPPLSLQRPDARQKSLAGCLNKARTGACCFTFLSLPCLSFSGFPTHPTLSERSNCIYLATLPPPPCKIMFLIRFAQIFTLCFPFPHTTQQPTGKLKEQANTRTAPPFGALPSGRFFAKPRHDAFARPHMQAAAAFRPPARGPDQRLLVAKQHP